VASVQSFTLWQQARTEISHYAHSIIGSPLLKEENHYTFRTIPQEHWLVEVSMARPS